MRLISQAPGGQPSNGSSRTPAISGDGRWIVFESDATNLSPEKAGSDSGIFMYDRSSESLELISSYGNDPSISADGRYIVFDKRLTGSNIYLYERETGLIKEIIKTIDGQPPDGDIWSPRISADGDWIAFWSWAGNLIPDDTEQCREGMENNFSCGDVFIYNRVTEQMERITMGEGYGLGMGVYAINLSGDGSRLSFSGHVFDHNMGLYLCDYCEGVLSADGQLVAYDVLPDFFVRDLTTGQVEQVSVDSNGTPGNGEWIDFSTMTEGPDFQPGFDISADGRFIAFSSTATNLTADEKQSCSNALFPPHSCYDIYIHDRETGLTELISKSFAGMATSQFFWSSSGKSRYPSHR